MSDAKSDTTSEKKRTLSVQRSSDYSIVYSDAVRTSLGPYDLKMTFSINELLPDEDVLITEIVTVVLTPQHAKVLAETLTRNVERYEKEIMPLETTEDFKKKEKRSIKDLLAQQGAVVSAKHYLKD